MKARLAQLSGRSLLLGSTAAAIVIAVVLNVLGARHYKRWDLTSDRRYSLSPATVETLRSLPETVHVWVLFSGGDPLKESVKQMLVAYQAETTKIEVHYIDPDKNPAGFADVKKRFKMDAGRTIGSSVVSDAVIVVSRDDRHWFISPSDLVEVENADDPRAKPREERALTGALRNVLGGDKPKLCFVTGHGERDLKDGSPDGIGFLQDLLEKDNYEVTSVDTTVPGAHEPFKGCQVAILPGPQGAFTKEEEARLRTYLLSGGNALFAVGPMNADTDTGLMRSGLGEALAPFGIGLEEDLVFETAERAFYPESAGIRFDAVARPHAVTQPLVVEAGRARVAPKTIVHFARSLHRVAGEGNAVPVDLLATSAEAYGVVNVVGAAEWTAAPAKKSGDIPGPLVLAMASERPKLAPSAAHGPRVVVIGTRSALLPTHWRVDGDGRGMAMLVENAIAWLSAKPQVLDVPDHQKVAAGIRITESSRGEIQRFVLAYIPLAAVLLGLVVFFMRRSGERAAYVPKTAKAPAKKAEASEPAATEEEDAPSAPRKPKAKGDKKRK